MPQCFSLTKIGATHPSKLSDIDREIAAFCGMECHPEKWTFDWYDDIGFSLAMGRTFDEIQTALVAEILDEPQPETLTSAPEGYYRQTLIYRLAIVAYLRANYVPNCWRE